MSRQGVRAEWTAIPQPIRDEIDGIAGSPVIKAVNLGGGFSPGPAARCDLGDGRTVFVKAVGSELNEHSPAMHRRESRVLSALPAGVPAPNLLGVADDGGWVALVIEWIDGRMPVAPLDTVDVQAMLDVVTSLAACGEGLALDGLERADGPITSVLHGHWATLITHPIDGLDAWSRRHLDELTELEAGWDEAVRGDHLVHGDLRTDNVLFTADNGAVIVDWPSAVLGAPWLDLVALLPALHLDGGPSPADALAHHPVGDGADGDAVNVFLAAVTGYFTRQALLPPRPGLPTVRAFQAAQGEISRRWLARRLGWD